VIIIILRPDKIKSKKARSKCQSIKYVRHEQLKSSFRGKDMKKTKKEDKKNQQKKKQKAVNVQDTFKSMAKQRHNSLCAFFVTI